MERGSNMSIKVEMNTQELSDLQQHMARLVEYYESDIRFLGVVRGCTEGHTQAYAQRLMCDRMEQLNSADALWGLLAQQ
jgi:hypothetical protein